LARVLLHLCLSKTPSLISGHETRSRSGNRAAFSLRGKWTKEKKLRQKLELKQITS
jgi:hypothetical protein